MASPETLRALWGFNNPSVDGVHHYISATRPLDPNTSSVNLADFSATLNAVPTVVFGADVVANTGQLHIETADAITAPSDVLLVSFNAAVSDIRDVPDTGALPAFADLLITVEP